MLKHLKKKWIQFGIGFLLLAFVFALQKKVFPYLDQFIIRSNSFIYDQILHLTVGNKSLPHRVVIIDIDDKSTQIEGRWPWPRDKFVTLLDNLKKAGVVVMAFDIVLSEAEINFAQGLEHKLQQLNNQPLSRELIPLLSKAIPLVDNDKAFAKVLSENEVILGFLFHDDSEVKKPALPAPLSLSKTNPADIMKLNLFHFSGYNGILPLFLEAAHHAGFVSNVPDLDGSVRHGLLLATYNNRLYASLALSTVMRFLLTDSIDLLTHTVQGKEELYGLNVGGIFIPTNSKGQLLIPFWGNPGTIPTYSATDIIQNKVSAQELSGTIALLGSTMVLLGDLHQAPLSQNFPGVEMNANIITGILEKQISSQFDWHTNKGVGIILTVGILLALLFPFLGPILLPLLFIIFISLILFVSYLVFNYKSIYVAPGFLLSLITLQALANFIYSFIQERRHKNRIKQLFGQYIPPSYMKEITDHPEQAHLEGESREMTVFFADIRGFTTLSESLDATELKRLLNSFFTPITNIIFDNQGTIDKYVGDMVMAFWGAPLHDDEHCQHAVKAALAIKAKLPEINLQLNQLNLPEVKIGMGLSTGIMNVGDMGSKFRLSYTVIGETVNLASRLQDLTKFYHVDILVPEMTRRNQEDILWLPVDKVIVKGSHKAVTIYEPQGYYADIPQETVDEIQDYEQALQSYYKQDWLNSKMAFEQLISRFPERYIYRMYLERINGFINNPPPANWDGAYIHIHK
ncbi:guanylate cyclase [Legionella birminghamensis]|uniref:Guanylate cyclase n=1 Tax=Legionella birminghamensis TaxID=28083 RepID=A0A378I9M8_9GAMM|nr:adenylate/guanylate cyclase domain-containing protein [Legionella birminghamensis]KTC68934.1 guanylate cyclase [Legionella birminghamensis]STX31450.1 guanylate cyclase [Legionella birminghamensis]